MPRFAGQGARETEMEIVLAALVAAGVAVAVVMLVQRPRTVQAGPSAVARPEPAPVPAEPRTIASAAAK